jgi:hypothetical protein
VVRSDAEELGEKFLQITIKVMLFYLKGFDRKPELYPN